MVTTVDTLAVEIRADMSQFRRQLSQVERQADRSSKRISSSLKGIGIAAGAYVGAQVTTALTRGSLAALKFASDIEESTSMSEAVFGRFVGSVREDLAQFADAVGRSKFELEGMAASIQDTFVPLGFAREEAAKMSVELTKLATDVASFKNASDPAVLNAFTSALVGNHEAVRSYGIVITEASLKQELFRMGITKSYDEVTNLEKVQARLNLIYAGTTDAQGDALRTADSFANKTRALSAAGEELIVNFFTPLLPVATKFVERMTASAEAVSAFLARIGYLDEAAQQSQELADAQAKMQEAIENLNNARIIEKNLIDGTTKAIGSQQKAIDNQRDMVALFEDEVRKATRAFYDLGGAGDVLKKLEFYEDELYIATTKLALEQEELARLMDKGATGMDRRYSVALNTAKNNVKNLTIEVEKLESAIGSINEGIEVDKLVQDVETALANIPVNKPSTTSETTAPTKSELQEIDRVKDAIKDLTTANQLLRMELRGVSEAEIEFIRTTSNLTGVTDEQAESIRKLVRESISLENALEKNKAFKELADDNKTLELRIKGVTREKLKFLELTKKLPPLTAKEEEALQRLIDKNFEYIDSLEGIDKVKSAVTQLTQDISNSLAEMVVNGKLDLDSFSSIFRSFSQQIIAEVLRLAVIRPIVQSITSALFPGVPLMAEGGPVKPNKPYIVGDAGPEIFKSSGDRAEVVGLDGPELFVSNKSGEIISNSQSKMMIKNSKNLMNFNKNLENSMQKFQEGGNLEANKTAVVGEVGPEIFIPSYDSKTTDSSVYKSVPSRQMSEMIQMPNLSNNYSKKDNSNDEKLAVVVNINQEITFTTDVKSSVRQEIQSEMPRINEAAVDAVTNSLNRNGSVRSALG